MADLTEQQASLSVKITGSDANGVETNYVDATADGLKVDGSAVTQPVSLASIPPGASTSANQVTEIASLNILASVVHAQNANLNQGVPLMGQLDEVSTIIATEGSVAVARITPQRSIHINLRNGSTGSEMIGQKTMGASVPVVLPSDQVLTVISSPLPVSGSGFTFGSRATNATTIVPVESTTYTEQLTNGQRSIASANANDTSAGTGARTVTITYLDFTGSGPFTEVLTLNGTTGVNTASTTICFIEKIVVNTIGSIGSNVGIISLYTAVNKGGSVFGSIAATINKTDWAHHYVPNGKTCYISGFSFFNDSTNGSNGALMVLKASYPTIANSTNLQISDYNGFPGSTGSKTRTYASPIQVIGPARITAYVTPYAGAAQVQYAAFDYIDN
jgi:hypothetical protein